MIEKLKFTDENTVKLKIMGDVQSVLEGYVDEKIMKRIDQKDFAFALGSGTFTESSCVGETIIIQGNPFVSWVENGETVTQTHSFVESPFLLGVDHVPNGIVQNYFPKDPTSLLNIYQNLAVYYPQGFILIAKILFSELQSTHLIKPPIYHENINEQASKYWAKKTIENQVEVCLFGVIIPPKGEALFSKKVLNKAFHQDPGEVSNSNYLSHAHGAVLKPGQFKYNEIQEDLLSTLKNISISSVRHILPDSLLQEGALMVFPITQIIRPLA